MTAKIPPTTRADILRQAEIRRKFFNEEKVENVAKHAAQGRARSISRKPVRPYAIVKRSSSDSQLGIRFRRLWEELTARQMVKDLIYGVIQLDAKSYREKLKNNHLPYWFFQKFTGDFRQGELLHHHVKRGLQKGYKKQAIYDAYVHELSLRLISDPTQIGISVYSSIEDLEAALQAVNTYVLLGNALYRQFKETFPGSSDKISYLFELFNNETWLQSTETLDLSFQPLNPDEENPIGITQFPTILCIKRLSNLEKLILAGQHLKTLPTPFFPYSRKLRHFDISHTPFLAFPKNFARTWDPKEPTWHLEEVHCHHTNLRTLPQSLLANTPHLRILNASHNPYLAKIEGNPAIDWPCIEEVDFSETPMFALPVFRPGVKINLSKTHVPPQQHPSPSESPRETSRASPRDVTSRLQAIQDQLIQCDRKQQ